MKTYILLFALLFSASIAVQAQRMACRNGIVTFTASTPLEKIEPSNSKVSSVVDTKTGKLEFAVLINAFIFEQNLMQEHFNENYMESDKFPKATFKGQIDNLSAIQWTKPGKYPAEVSGNLTLHGVTKPVKTKGEITVTPDGAKMTSNFKITIADYGIEIPSVVREKISKDASIKVNCEYKPMG